MPVNKQNAPIGVFDSGLGGLTVMKEMMSRLKQEDIIYYGDTARVPYGTKSRQSIIRFSRTNTTVLMQHHVKMIVVACNSSSSYAMPTLRKHFNIPLLGVIEPGVKAALAATRNKKIGIAATSATIASGAYEKKLRKFSSSVKVYSQSCPLFVPIVEEGRLEGAITRAVIKDYLDPLLSKGIDTLILGCTHYPLLKQAIAKVAGENVTLIDSAQAVANAVAARLENLDLCCVNRRRSPKYKIMISDRPQNFPRIAENFLKKKLPVTVRR